MQKAGTALACRFSLDRDPVILPVRRIGDRGGSLPFRGTVRFNRNVTYLPGLWRSTGWPSCGVRMNNVMWLLTRMRSTTVTERQPVHPPSAANISSIRTGIFAGEGTNQPNFTVAYLTAVPNCIGLTSIRVLPRQGTAFLNAATLSEIRPHPSARSVPRSYR